jgi:probable phosphoglycerate mutase
MSPATRVLAIRHGETAWNADSRIQGQLDVGLNDTGRWQAACMAQSLAGEVFDAIYSSDLSRARATAEALAAVAGLEVQPDRGLRERGFGLFEGQTYREIEQTLPEQAARWRRREPDFGAEGGETLTGFYDRALATATRLAAGHPGQSIVLVTHGGVLDCLYRAATRIALQAPRTWSLGNTSLNRLLHTELGFTLVGWGDSHHLDIADGDDSTA